MEKVIVVEDLQKTYKPKSRRGPIEVKALDGISFEVERGEFFGLLGPNGAGKTTTIGVLTTRVLPTGGRRLGDRLDVKRNPGAVKPRIGVCPPANKPDRRPTGRREPLFPAEELGIPKPIPGRTDAGMV